MKDAEYGDMWKFITSIGVALIAFGFSLRFLIINQHIDLVTAISEHFDKEISRPLLDKMVVDLMKFYEGRTVWTVLLVSLGLVVLVVGLFLWGKRQIIRDKIEDKGLLNVVSNTTSATMPERVFSYVTTESSGEVAEEVVGFGTQPSIMLNVSEGKKNEYLNIEKRLQRIVSNATGEKYHSIANRRIEEFEFDLILVGKGNKQLVLIEVKYYQGRELLRRVREAVARLSDATKAFRDKVGNPTKIFLVFLVKEGTSIEISQSELRNIREKVKAEKISLIIESEDRLSDTEYWKYVIA